jgi:hypothetical protein
MTDIEECGCVHLSPTGPKLRLVRADPLDPAQVIPVPMSAVYTEARRLARQQVKINLQRQGINQWRMEHADIVRAGNAYLADHPDLLLVAKERLTKLR